MEEYTLEQLREILTPEVVEDAFNMGIVYDVDEGGEVHICFPNDGDPGCQFSYICISDLYSDEWDMLSAEEKYQMVVDALIMLVEDDADTYATEVTHYVDMMLGK